MMKQERVRLTQRTWCKVLAFFLAVLSALAAVGCGVLFAGMWENEFYTKDPALLRDQYFQQVLQRDGVQVMYLVHNGIEGPAGELSENVVGYRATGAGVPGGVQTWGDTTGQGRTLPMRLYEDEEGWIDYWSEETNPNAQVTLYLARPLRVKDRYWLATEGISLFSRYKYWFPVIALGSLVLNLVCLVFLLCAAGHRRKDPEVHPGWGTRLPLELLLLGFGLAMWGLVMLEWLLIDALYAGPLWCCLGIGAAAALGYSLVLGLLMSLAVRIKLRVLWRNTLLYWILHALFVAVRWFFRLLGKLPQVWKTMLIFAGVSLAELMVFLAYSVWCENAAIVLWWLAKKLVEFPIVLYVAVSLQRLRQAGQRMAGGDFSPVNTGGLIWDMKRHGEDLNSLSLGMNRAVDARMRSERMKTELITNVSHDLKTPLTSIVSYADLIGQEPCENEKIKEYSQVLLRQSQRLKRLIEDLVEASKAASGSLELHPEPLELGVLLTQAAGEYQRRLEEAGLTLVEPKPQAPVYILGDGKRMWRVLDNLMGNVLKYAQPGTRVYLDLQSDGRQAEISLRNVSREMLNVPPAELLERFTRGDAARHSEGNGLGLSIANSLTQLQGGTLLLAVDGDLFKVLLRFPQISDPENAGASSARPQAATGRPYKEEELHANL